MQLSHEKLWRLKSRPYSVQVEALRRSYNRRGHGHFLEMGLGKTAVTFAEYEQLRQDNKVDCLIVLCPSDLKQNWKAEGEKFEIDVPMVVWENNKEKDWYKKISEHGQFCLFVNYEAVDYRFGQYLEDFLASFRVMLVCDESVKLKEPRGKRATFIRKLAEKATVRRALSGKPVLNNLGDLWGQLKFLGAYPRMTFYQYRNRYCQMGGYLQKNIVGHKNEEDLYSFMEDWAWFAQKKDWTDLPEKSYTYREAELTPIQKEYYDSMRKDFLVQLNEDEAVSVDMIIAALGKMRQISTGFIINEEKKAIPLLDFDKTPKFQSLLSVLEETSDKGIVFCFHRYTTQMLIENLEKKGYNPAYLKGQMTPEEIAEQKKKFNEDLTCKVIVCQTSSSKYGHTLLGEQEKMPCTWTCFFENTYSLDDRAQAEDRNHRHGQKNPVLYIDLITSDLDRKILRCLQQKGDLSQAVMDWKREAQSG